MERLNLYTLAAQNISSALLVATYTATAAKEILVSVSLSGLAGNGTYRAALTRQIAGAGSFYQSATGATAVAATVTTAYIPTTPLAVNSGDVVKVYAQGLAADTSVAVNVEVFDVTAAPTGAAMTLATGAITAAVVATGAIDADALATDAGAEIADAVWDEATSGHSAAGSFGLWASGLVAAITAALTASATYLAAIAAAIWAYATRTLTSTAAATTAAVSGSALAVVKPIWYHAVLSSLTWDATWTKAYLTIKHDPSQTAAEAILQIVVSNQAAAATDGVLIVKGATATAAQRTQGSIAVSVAGGTLTIDLDMALVAVLAEDNLGYDVVEFYTDGAVTKNKLITRSTVAITATETDALA